MGTLHNRPHLLRYRRNLRRNPTRAEQYLWRRLRRRQLEGRKFRRQHSIGRFIVDFYCPSERLVIELDGSVHHDPLRSEYDVQRQSYMEEMGLTVLRFRNEDVLDQVEAVLASISASFRKNE